MPPTGYLQTFRQRWAVVVGTLAVCVGIAVAVILVTPVTYTAKATLFLTVESSTATLAERSQFSLARVGSYPDLVYSSEVLGPAAEIAAPGASLNDVAARVQAGNPTGTLLVEVIADGPTPEEAAGLANAVGASLAALVSDIENSSRSTATVELELRSPAQPPLSPSAPQRAVILGLGIVAGLALGAALALAIAYFDPRIRTAEDVRRVTGLPVVGQFRRPSRFSRSHRIDPERDGFTEAALNLRQAIGGAAPELLLLVPSSTKVASTSSELGLALAYAHTGRDVLIIGPHADQRHPATADFGQREGVAELLADPSRSISPVLRPVEVEGPGGEVWAVPRGIEVPTEVVVEQGYDAAIAKLLDYADVALAQADGASRPLSARLLAPSARLVVIVARFGTTTVAELGRAVADLRLEGIRPVGVLLTDVPSRLRSDLAAGWRADDFEPMPRPAPGTPSTGATPAPSGATPSTGATPAPSGAPAGPADRPAPTAGLEGNGTSSSGAVGGHGSAGHGSAAHGSTPRPDPVP